MSCGIRFVSSHELGTACGEGHRPPEFWGRDAILLASINSRPSHCARAFETALGDAGQPQVPTRWDRCLLPLRQRVHLDLQSECWDAKRLAHPDGTPKTNKKSKHREETQKPKTGEEKTLESLMNAWIPLAARFSRDETTQKT